MVLDLHLVDIFDHGHGHHCPAASSSALPHDLHHVHSHTSFTTAKNLLTYSKNRALASAAGKRLDSRWFGSGLGWWKRNQHYDGISTDAWPMPFSDEARRYMTTVAMAKEAYNDSVRAGHKPTALWNPGPEVGAHKSLHHAWSNLVKITNPGWALGIHAKCKSRGYLLAKDMPGGLVYPTTVKPMYTTVEMPPELKENIEAIQAGKPPTLLPMKAQFYEQLMANEQSSMVSAADKQASLNMSAYEMENKHYDCVYDEWKAMTDG